MAASTYPNLGFDPCPGSPESVSTLLHRVSTAAASVQQANELLGRLRSDQSGVWQGAAGDAFRSHLNATLIEDLARGNQSLNRAVTTMQGWSAALQSFRQSAGALESQAAQAQQRLATAREEQQRAASNADLQLAGRVFGNEADLRLAQQRLDHAVLVVRRANGEVDAAEDALEHIRRQARALHDEWDQASSRAAGELKQAAEQAPHHPGLLRGLGQDIANAASDLWDWAGSHLEEIHTVLSAVSAVSGLLALCTPPPVDVIALGVSLVAGAGALASTLANPAIRKDLGEVLHGDFEGNWGSVLQLGGDVLTLVPGVGVGVGVAKNGDVLAEGIRGFPKVVDIVSNVAHEPGFVMKKVEQFVPSIGGRLEDLRLLEPTMGTRPGAAADMLNFLNKTVGAGKKTVGVVVDAVNGSDD